MNAGKRVLSCGIGITICIIKIARHGGKVWAEGVEGSGATFGFSIPK